jgi:hypothetical protein
VVAVEEMAHVCSGGLDDLQGLVMGLLEDAMDQQTAFGAYVKKVVYYSVWLVGQGQSHKEMASL